MKNINSVSVVSDGSYLLDGGPFFGPVPKVLWEKQAKPDRKNRVRLGLNSLLIMSANETAWRVVLKSSLPPLIGIPSAWIINFPCDIFIIFSIS